LLKLFNWLAKAQQQAASSSLVSPQLSYPSITRLVARINQSRVMRASSALFGLVVVQLGLAGGRADDCTYPAGKEYFVCYGKNMTPLTFTELQTSATLEAFWVGDLASPLEFDFPTTNAGDYFKELKHLSIKDTNVTNFEPVAGSLANLETVLISGAATVNTNLSAIAHLTSIVSLELSHFDGLAGSTIPQTLQALQSLTSLSLQGLKLSGTLPELVLTSGLRTIKLAGNNLSGGCVPHFVEKVDIDFVRCAAPTTSPTTSAPSTATPTMLPTSAPTNVPTKLPTGAPTRSPSAPPSTESPTEQPVVDLQSSDLPLLIGAAAGGVAVVMLVGFGLFKAHKSTSKLPSGSLMSQPAVDRHTGREQDNKKHNNVEAQLTSSNHQENTVFDPIKGWVAGADSGGGKQHKARPPTAPK
jgi:hypothetical protein